jgi:hypothetical protein
LVKIGESKEVSMGPYTLVLIGKSEGVEIRAPALIKRMLPGGGDAFIRSADMPMVMAQYKQEMANAQNATGLYAMKQIKEIRLNNVTTMIAELEEWQRDALRLSKQ